MLRNARLVAIALVFLSFGLATHAQAPPCGQYGACLNAFFVVDDSALSNFTVRLWYSTSTWAIAPWGTSSCSSQFYDGVQGPSVVPSGSISATYPSGAASVVQFAGSNQQCIVLFGQEICTGYVTSGNVEILVGSANGLPATLTDFAAAEIAIGTTANPVDIQIATNTYLVSSTPNSFPGDAVISATRFVSATQCSRPGCPTTVLPAYACFFESINDVSNITQCLLNTVGNSSLSMAEDSLGNFMINTTSPLLACVLRTPANSRFPINSIGCAYPSSIEQQAACNLVTNQQGDPGFGPALSNSHALTADQQVSSLFQNIVVGFGNSISIHTFHEIDPYSLL